MVAIPFWAHLSDRLGRRPVYLAGAVISLLYALPFFWLLATGKPSLVWLALIFGLNVGHDLMYGPQAAYFSELFRTQLRYSGASLVYQLASVVSGGVAPLIATWLLARSGSGAVAGYMMVMCGLTVIATWYAPETHKREIE